MPIPILGPEFTALRVLTLPKTADTNWALENDVDAWDAAHPRPHQIKYGPNSKGLLFFFLYYYAADKPHESEGMGHTSNITMDFMFKQQIPGHGWSLTAMNNILTIEGPDTNYYENPPPGLIGFRTVTESASPPGADRAKIMGCFI